MKYHIPQLSGTLLARPRLIARLDAAARHPLTLIAAPAGFGKTTLLAAWLVERMTLVGSVLEYDADLATGSVRGARRPAVAWLTLDSHDNDPVRLVRSILTALQAALPRLAAPALPRLQPRRIEPFAVLARIIHTALDRDDAVTLIIDDIHVLTNPAANALLAALVEQRHPRLRLVFAGRADPPLSLARLRAYGQLHEIRAVDLRFSPEESLALLASLTGLTLTLAQIAPIIARAEGWVVGLQLAARILQNTDQIAERLAAFNGAHRFVLDYFTDEVLARQSEPIQEFLLMTSLLDRFSAGMCATLLAGDAPPDTAAAQRQLEDLVRANLFVIPLDEAHCWYRYHHLFADLLRHRVYERCPERVPLIHGRAARWCAEQGMFDDAIAHALAAGDADYAGELIARVGRGYLAKGELTTVQRWLAALPPARIAADPALLILNAWILAWDYQPAALEALLQYLPKVLPLELAAEAAALQAFLAAGRNDWARAIALSEEVLRAVPDNIALAGFVYASLGDIYWMMERAQQAVNCHRCSLECACQCGDMVQLVDATHSLAQFELLQGRLTAAEAVYDYGTDRLAHHGAHTTAFARLFAFGRASIHFERYELAAARQNAEEGLAYAAHCGLRVYEPFIYAELARIAAAQGDTATVQRALLATQQGAQRMIARNNGRMSPWIGFLRLREVEIALILGDLTSAARWAIDHGHAATCADATIPAVRQYALAQVCIACLDQPALLRPLTEDTGMSIETIAADMISRSLQSFSAWGLESLVIELQVMAAVLWAARHDLGAAHVALADALRRAAPEGVIRPFVQRGQPLRQLLGEALNSRWGVEYGSVERAFAERMLQYFTTLSAPSEPTMMPLDSNASLVEPLSPREREVLPLLAAGLSHREIAAALTIAPDTARTHIRNIYGKLQVRNRTQAIERARIMALM